MIGLLSIIEPTFIDEALYNDGWIMVMQGEVNQFQRNDVGDLVTKSYQKDIIGTKWVFKNKFNDQGEVVRNKDRRVAQGYYQQECIDFSETFTLVVRLEEIKLLISYVINHNIILYQMYVNYAF